MSYCRFGEADVYVFFSAQGYLECCGCSLSSDWTHRSTADMLAHLQAHREAGDQVPRWVDEAIQADDAKNFPGAGQEPRSGGSGEVPSGTETTSWCLTPESVRESRAVCPDLE